MPINVTTLERLVTPIVLDLFDRESSESHLPLLAQMVTHRDPRSNLVTLEWVSAFPEMRRWIGDRATQKVFKDDLEARIHPYEITLSLDRNRLTEDGQLLDDPEDLAGPVVRGFMLGKVLLALSILRDNPEAYDGQDFFDTDHVQPDESTTYSNLLTRGTDTVARTTDASPTPAEVREELKVIMATLLQNSIIQNALVESADVSEALVVITRNYATWSAFEDLRTEERIGGDINRFRGRFRLMRDMSPPSGTELSYDVVHAVPGGPRPSVFVTAKEIGGLEFDRTKEFSSRHLPFGSDGRYGVAAGFPQTSVRCKAP